MLLPFLRVGGVEVRPERVQPLAPAVGSACSFHAGSLKNTGGVSNR